MNAEIRRLLDRRTGAAARGALPSVVTSPKSSPAYQVHSYPTKIPPEAIVPFIEASTTPGAIVLDPFCGSGMTGVAALASGRSVILSDLSPGAVHLAKGHTTPAAPHEIMTALEALDAEWMRNAERSLYSTSCPTCCGPAVARHTIWSDVQACEACGAEVVLWDEADPENGSVPKWLDCPSCDGFISRAGSVPVRSEPVFKVVSCRNGCAYLQDGATTDEDVDRLDKLARKRLEHWFPDTPIESTREMYKRSALHLHAVTTVEDFYLPRAKHALSELWHEINRIRPERVRDSLRFAFTNTAWHASKMRRYNARGGQRPLTGTLYIPQLSSEANAFEVFRHQVKQLAAFAGSVGRADGTASVVRKSSAADLSWLPDGSIDYVFTDPPFGSNIFYADCNIIWEAWLGDVTDTGAEMVVNRSRTRADGGKSVDDYEDLLSCAFSEIRRVLKPNGRASIVFHNSDDKVWSAMLRAAERAGLRQTDVSILDKVQRSMKGYKGRSGRELVPFYDLVISFASGTTARPALNGAGEIAMHAVHRHLGNIASAAPDARERSLEFLYSLALGQIVAVGARPDGLSYRAFERLCSEAFERRGKFFTLT